MVIYAKNSPPVTPSIPLNLRNAIDTFRQGLEIDIDHILYPIKSTSKDNTVWCTVWRPTKEEHRKLWESVLRDQVGWIQRSLDPTDPRQARINEYIINRIAPLCREIPTAFDQSGIEEVMASPKEGYIISYNPSISFRDTDYANKIWELCRAAKAMARYLGMSKQVN